MSSYIISLPLSNAAGTCWMHMQDQKYKTEASLRPGLS